MATIASIFPHPPQMKAALDKAARKGTMMHVQRKSRPCWHKIGFGNLH